MSTLRLQISRHRHFAVFLTLAFCPPGMAESKSTNALPDRILPEKTIPEQDPSEFPTLVESHKNQFLVSLGVDFLGPVTWQLFVRPRQNTKRVIDQNHISYTGKARYDFAANRGSLFLQPIFRLIPEWNRADSRDFSDALLDFIQLTRIRAQGYGVSIGWAVGSMNEWSAWRPWVSLSIEKSVVNAEVWVSDAKDSGGSRYNLSSALIAAHSVFGISWNPLEKVPNFGTEFSIMLPLGAVYTSGQGNKNHYDAGSSNEGSINKKLNVELHHRPTTAIGFGFTSQLRF